MVSRMGPGIGLVGAGGRMGVALIRALADLGLGPVAAAERPGHAAIGRDAGDWIGIETLGVVIGDDQDAVLARAKVVIDFTAPSASVALAARAARAGVALVIGTTGLSAEDDRAIAQAAEAIPIVKSGNYSLGVNVLLNLIERVARVLPDFDLEIVEMHHRHKVDAPSGTALMMGEAAARGRNRLLEDLRVSARVGHTGVRPEGAIGFQSLRGGTVVGEHSLIAAGPRERIELRHVAEDRAIFAQGAVAAARWVAGRAPGLYTMADVLDL